MKTKINYKGIVESLTSTAILKRLLPICLLTSQAVMTPNFVYAEDVRLQQLQPAMDTSVPAAVPFKKLLNGQVSREDAEDGAPTETVAPGRPKVIISIQNGGGAVNLSAGQLQSITDALSKLGLDTGSVETSSGGKPGFSGLSQRPRTADDFRAMEYGVIGMVSTKFSGANPEVSAVYPTCPAALAGIQMGDLVVKANGYVFGKDDGPQVFWQRVAGKAGSPIAVTILRDGELMTFNMTRMNIEDIADLKVRNRYERVLGLFGPPTGGELQVAKHHKHNSLFQRVQDESSSSEPSSPSESAGVEP